MPLPSSATSTFFSQYYYSKSDLNAGALDSRYFAESEFLNTSAGAGDAGKPIKLDASGQVDASMLAGGSVATHAALTAAHGATGAVVGTTNTQTLTNKTLTTPTINGSGSSSLATLQPTSGVYTQLSLNNAAGTQKVTLGWDETNGLGYLTGDGAIVHLKASKVGINKNNPSQALDVTGTINASVGVTVGGVAVATTTGTETLTNKTLASPTISGSLVLPLANFSIGVLASVDPLINLDSNDYIRYTRSSDTFDLFIGGLLRFEVRDAGTSVTNLNATGIITQNSVPVATTTGTQTLTNKTLTSPAMTGATTNTLVASTSVTAPILYGSSSANGDIAIHGTSNGTKTTSYVQLNPSGGDVVVGGSTTDFNFEIQDAGASNYRFTFNLNDSGTNVLGSINGAVGSFTRANMRIFADRLVFDTSNFNLPNSSTPSSATDTGTTGDIKWDSNFIYVAVGTNSWRRAALSTW